MSNTLGLDPQTWDLCADENGNWPVLTQCEAVTQNIRACLQACRGEWFLDGSLGVPTLSALGANPDLESYEAAVKSAILGVEGVDSLRTFSIESDPSIRRVCTNFTGVTTCGDDFGVSL